MGGRYPAMADSINTAAKFCSEIRRVTAAISKRNEAARDETFPSHIFIVNRALQRNRNDSFL